MTSGVAPSGTTRTNFKAVRYARLQSLCCSLGSNSHFASALWCFGGIASGYAAASARRLRLEPRLDGADLRPIAIWFAFGVFWPFEILKNVVVAQRCDDHAFLLTQTNDKRRITAGLAERMPAQVRWLP